MYSVLYLIIFSSTISTVTFHHLYISKILQVTSEDGFLRFESIATSSPSADEG